MKKWKEKVRIDERLDVIECILKLNTDSYEYLGLFNVTIYDTKSKIDHRSIRTYLDVGCRNGEITAAISARLKLQKHKTFGADSFDAKHPKLTFALIDKSQHKIRIREYSPSRTALKQILPLHLANDSVDLITCFVTLHHVSDVTKMINELARVLRPGAVLIISEYNCETQYSIVSKYLNFIHAIMMIARVGECADVSDRNEWNSAESWERQKERIVQYTNSIRYRRHNGVFE